MDEELDDVMAPMVDALTGAVAAVLLISVFLMINTMNGASDALKNYKHEALYKNDRIINDALRRRPPEVDLKTSEINFFKSFKLTSVQIKYLKEYFKGRVPIKITVESNDSESVLTYNLLLFVTDLGFQKNIDDIEINYISSKLKNGSTKISWELK